MIQKAFSNYKTTIAGLLAGISIAAPILSKVGIHLGHYGATDFVQLAGAIATTVLGMAAGDAGK